MILEYLNTIIRILSIMPSQLLEIKIIGLLATEERRFGELLGRVTKNPKHLSNLLSSLEKKSIIKWRPDPKDRRVKMYYLTKKGEQTDYYRQKELGLFWFANVRKARDAETPKNFEEAVDRTIRYFTLVGTALYNILQLGKSQGILLTTAIDTFVRLLISAELELDGDYPKEFVELHLAASKGEITTEELLSELNKLSERKDLSGEMMSEAEWVSEMYKKSYSGTEEGIDTLLEKYTSYDKKKQKEIKEFIFSF